MILNTKQIKRIMSLESDEKAYLEGLKIWGQGKQIDQALFENWVDHQSLSVLEFTRDIFNKYEYTFLGEYVQLIIDIKNSQTKNNFGIDIKSQLN